MYNELKIRLTLTREMVTKKLNDYSLHRKVHFQMSDFNYGDIKKTTTEVYMQIA